VRFKLDENLSRSVAELFRAAGHDVATVREQQLHGAPDEDVFDASVREGRALVTLDRDLGQVLRFPPAKSSGIVVIDPGPRAERCSNGRGSSWRSPKPARPTVLCGSSIRAGCAFT
jgi:hypothetical protein